MSSMDFASPKTVRIAGLAFAAAAATQAMPFLFGTRSASPHSLRDALMIAGGAALIAAGFAFLHEKRAIENVPRSRVRSVAMGFASILGMAKARTPIMAPLSGTRCVFYKYLVEQEESGGRGGSSWQTVDQGQSVEWFDLDDGTGTIVVDPDHIEVALGRDYRTIDRAEGLLGRRQRCTEWRLHEGETAYVAGTVRSLRNLAQDRQAALHVRLRDIKRDPERMKTFDTDHDGTISTEEWGNVVRVAQDEILREAVAAPPGPPEDNLIIARGESESTFVISDQGERAILRTLSLKAGFALLAGAALAVAGIVALLARTGATGAGIAIPR
jgi:hypothetical protein